MKVVSWGRGTGSLLLLLSSPVAGSGTLSPAHVHRRPRTENLPPRRPHADCGPLGWQMRTGSTPRGLGVRERQSPGAGPLPLLHVAHLTASGRGGPRMRDGSWSFTDKWPGCQHPDRWAHTGPQARVGTSGFHLCVLADARAQQGVLGTCGVPRPPIPSSSRRRCPESKTKPWLPGSPQRMGRELDGHREARGTRPRHRLPLSHLAARE